MNCYCYTIAQKPETDEASGDGEILTNDGLLSIYMASMHKFAVGTSWGVKLQDIRPHALNLPAPLISVRPRRSCGRGYHFYLCFVLSGGGGGVLEKSAYCTCQNDEKMDNPFSNRSFWICISKLNVGPWIIHEPGGSREDQQSNIHCHIATSGQAL